ncbi:7-carboxy-7-deazaguanine synthase QueE [Anaerophaga thermohalophila]|uniref:7-carboxy-7-deazaguanine synthase QueE n=1 Tax=Anaerophaga thermohalophila TaxID=177400 RepID=UPI0002EB27AD|nr:7-carboxy-7-deazaguanine synthase QueE [Anaerophaga thermohalophila]
MSKLVLANEGVFPVTHDRHGCPIKESPATNLGIPGTIQGEGKLAGIPSIFVRLAGCNLRCIWTLPDGSFCRCDTPYASFEAEQQRQPETAEVFDLVKQNTGKIKHVVITGGEPLLQHKALAPLCKRLKEELNLHLTIETNGTIFAEDVAQYIDLFSLSPKLSNSNPSPAKTGHYQLRPSGPITYHAQKRRNIDVIQKFIDYSRNNKKDFQLKFVVGRHNDYVEIKNEFLAHLTEWRPEDVLLMPLGATKEELKTTSLMVLEMAISNGWRYAPRLHIGLFGPKAGV